jgi:hypothetical protein
MKAGGLHYGDYEFTTSMSKEEVGNLITELEVALRESEESYNRSRSGVDYQVLDDWSDRYDDDYDPNPNVNYSK